MDREQLRSALSDIEINQAELATLVGVTPRAVSLWMTGGRSVPGPVEAYVNLMKMLPIEIRQAEISRLEKGVRTMKEGMYLVEFAGRAGEGACALIFDGGRIYGADTAAAKYDGTYVFNDSTGLVEVSIRVEMPANVESVIGFNQPFDWILEVTTTMDPDWDQKDIEVQTNLGQPIRATYRFLRTIPIAA